MTQDKNFKRAVRERMERTGESYTAARRAMLAQPPPARPAPTKLQLEAGREYVDGHGTTHYVAGLAKVTQRDGERIFWAHSGEWFREDGRSTRYLRWSIPDDRYTHDVTDGAGGDHDLKSEFATTTDKDT